MITSHTFAQQQIHDFHMKQNLAALLAVGAAGQHHCGLWSVVCALMISTEPLGLICCTAKTMTLYIKSWSLLSAVLRSKKLRHLSILFCLLVAVCLFQLPFLLCFDLLLEEPSQQSWCGAWCGPAFWARCICAAPAEASRISSSPLVPGILHWVQHARQPWCSPW